MSVTILHAADLHLGSPLQAVEDASKRLERDLARATYDAFRRIVTVGIEREVDFVVLAGDLYDREARSVKANEFLAEQFARLEEVGIPCYVVHGNHDPLGEGSEKLDLPDNVHVFGSGEVETAYFPDSDSPKAEIFGQSYGNRHESGSIYYYYTPEDRSIPNIGVLHTGLDPDGRRYAPCSSSDLASKDIDYWALGHIHTPSSVEGAQAAYSGVPQARHIGETEVGGCLLVDIEANEEPEIEFVPTSPIIWQRIGVDISDTTAEGSPIRNLTDTESYIDDIALELRTLDYQDFLTEMDISVAEVKWSPEGVVCRWELTGRGELHDILDREATTTLADRLRDRLSNGSPFVWTEDVRDRTAAPLPDTETLIEDDEVIGELVTLAEEIHDDPDACDDLRSVTGEVWEWVDDPDRDDIPADRFALHPERLDDLLDQAVTQAIDELAKQRYDAH